MLVNKKFFGRTGDNPLIIDRPSGWGKWERTLKGCKLLSNEEQCRLVFLAQDGCDVSLDKVVKSCLRLVMPVAKYYFKYNRRNSMLTALDYVQYGNEGLVQAVYKFKNDRDCSFASYAMFHIKGVILSRAFSEMDFVKIPSQNQKDENGERKPPVEILGLDELLPENKQGEGVETYLDICSVSSLADNDVLIKDFRLTVEVIFKSLTQRECEVMKLFFLHQMSLEDIGEMIGLTRERTRQVKDKAVTKMRYRCRHKYLYGVWDLVSNYGNEMEWEESQQVIGEEAKRIRSENKVTEIGDSVAQLQRIADAMNRQEAIARKEEQARKDAIRKQAEIEEKNERDRILAQERERKRKLQEEEKQRQENELAELKKAQAEELAELEKYRLPDVASYEISGGKIEWNDIVYERPANPRSIKLILRSALMVFAKKYHRQVTEIAIKMYYDEPNKKIAFQLYVDGYSTCALQFNRDILGLSADPYSREELINVALVKGLGLRKSVFRKYGEEYRRGINDLSIFVSTVNPETVNPVFLLYDEYKFLQQLYVEDEIISALFT